MAYSLVFTNGALAGQSFPLGEGALVVGRSRRACGVTVARDDPTVSRQHVALRVVGGRVVLTNLASRESATRVGATVVPPRHKVEVPPGVAVALGEQGGTVFTVEAGEAPTDAGGGETQAAATLGDAASAAFGGGEQTVAEARNTLDGAYPPSEASPRSGCPGRGARTNAAPSRATMATQAAATMATQVAATMAPGGTGFSPFGGEADDEGGPETRPMPTVMADAREIQAIIDEGNWQRRRRLFQRIACAVLLFLGAAALYHFMRPRPETVLTWPRRASDGAYDTREVPLATPLGEGFFWLVVPNSERLAVERGDDGEVRVSTWLGRARDVPLHVAFACRREARFARTTRQALFREHLRGLEETGAWNFQAQAPLAFLGADNGLPYLEVQYFRSVRTAGGTEQRFGYLLFAVYADCTLVVTREIPALEQWRGGGDFLRERLLGVSAAALDGRWEGRADFRDEPVADMLAEADGLLSRKAPALWKEVEFLLQSALVKSLDDEEGRQRALARLRMLREKERNEFSRLRIAWEKHRRLGQKEACQADMDEALRIFSSPEDRRHARLQKGDWE